MRASVRWVSLPLVVFVPRQCLRFRPADRPATRAEPQTAVDRRADAARHHDGVATRRTAVQVAAAVSVIRGEDIRRSGAANLAEALRLADGVARRPRRQRNLGDQHPRLQHLDRQQAAGADRRADGLFAALLRRLLVVQDVRSTDIDRIEVIRGPGGAAVGRERGQRRRQHHHQERGRDAGRRRSR